MNRDFGPSPGKLQRLEDNANPDLKQIFLTLPYTSFRCSKIASKLHSTIQKYTPNFRLKVAFQTIQLSSVILPRLKPRKTYFFNSNVVYKFECNCSKTYIGETKKLLKSRIFQHRTSTTSHIHKHIVNCQPYIDAEKSVYGDQPSESQKRENILTHFKIIERNLQNTHMCKGFEGLMITLQKPELNKQVYHRKTALICNCIFPTIASQPGPVIEQS